MTHKLKICLIGATGVGKTSLVGRFVHSIFSESYHTTIGVKIEKRRVERPGGAVDLIIWDLSGEDEFQSVQPAYLRGTAGYLLVVDGTRRETFDTAMALEAKTRATVGRAPFLVVINKADMTFSWSVQARDEQALTERGWRWVRTSAKTGAGVETAFDELIGAIEASEARSWT